MTEIFVGLAAGSLGGVGLGFFFGFKQGAKAQAELGVVLKKVPILGTQSEAVGTGGDTQPTPKFKANWPRPEIGQDHPSGHMPASPQDFTRVSPPEGLVEKLKSVGR